MAEGARVMYRWLLRAFPREFRREFGPEMMSVFDDRLRDARAAGIRALLALWCRTVVDVIQHGLAERHDARRRRGDSTIRSFFQDVRFSLRLFRQRPGFTASAVLTLALGIGINVAVFSVVNGVLVRWLALPHPDEVVRFAEIYKGIQQPLSARSFASLRADTRELFQSLSAYRTASATLTGAGDAVMIPAAYVDAEFFDVLGVGPLMGRRLTADDARPGNSAVVVSNRFWRGRLGGDSSVIGRTIELNGDRATIVGVMPDYAVFPAGVEMWRPLTVSKEELASARNRSFSSIGRLKPGLTLPVVNSAIARANAGYTKADGNFAGWGAGVFNLHDDATSELRRDLVFLQSVALVVLLIGCANIANLLLAASSERRRELSIRASIGAGRRRLVRQLFAESLVLALIGAVGGVLLAMWLVPAAVSFYPRELPGLERIGIRLPELAAALAAAIGTTVLFGLAPAVFASRADLSAVLKGGSRSGSTRLANNIRWSLVAAEVMLCLSLLAGAALLVRSYARLTLQPIGFDPRSVLTAQVTLPADRYPTEAARRVAFDTLVDRLRRQAGVVDVATTMPMSFDGMGAAGGFRRVGDDADRPVIVTSMQTVSPDYLKVFRIPLLRGRFFSAADAADRHGVLVVNQQFVEKFAKGADVIGMRLSDEKRVYEIIGVVADSRFNFYQQPKPFVLRLAGEQDLSTTKLAIRTTGSPEDVAPLVRTVVRELDPRLPVVPQSLQSVVAKSVAARRFNMTMLAALAALALVLSVVGIYGVMSYVVSQRRRELGIRVALGAAPGNVQRYMVRQGLTPMLAGIAGGLAGAWYLTTLLKKELFEITPHDPWPLSAAAIGFLLVGVAACWLPARRSARVNPVEVLRAE